jgi:hypothetical protein
MQRFVLLGSVVGVAGGGVTAAVQHSDDVIDVLSVIKGKMVTSAPAPDPGPASLPGPPENSIAPAACKDMNQDLMRRIDAQNKQRECLPPVGSFGPLPLSLVRVVDVRAERDGGGFLSGSVEWDFTLTDVLTDMPLALESRAYRQGGDAESFGAERAFAQLLDKRVAVLVEGWFHDRWGRRELRIRQLVHVDFRKAPDPVRVSALRGEDWGTFDIQLELAEPAKGARPTPS